ncbi:scavenger receptor class F member 1-like [Gigantopelta aegis]|uniref:scavenger receptor class F member 1-like n=1 Tax=Gigantopelta aegis TaxID=1735272 RepID=UPI001B88BFC0|nr:scavenger receptor class F member 1-like [Gigantopelta aegis]
MSAVRSFDVWFYIVVGYCFLQVVQLQENVALNKATTQSPECPGYEGASHLAVDGNITTEFGQSKPHACACAKGISSTFWSVDLGKPYRLHNIRIFQRNSNHFTLNGFSVSVDASPCYQWTNSWSPPTVFNITCDKTGQIVKFSVPRTDYFVLCEVQIFVCADYYYGDVCDKTCNCRVQNEVCDKRTGACTSGCPPKWMGTACDTCDDRYWGTSCTRPCSTTCKEASCDRVNGNCQSCDDRYWGTSCSRPCSTTCKETSCDRVNGNCQCTYWVLFQ